MHITTALSSLILALPFTLSMPTTPSTAHTLTKRVANCQWKYGGLKYADCLSATSQIPHSTTPMQYNQNGNNDLSGLPFIWSVGECTIAADLIRPSQSEIVTWLDIAAAAHDILLSCVQPNRRGGDAVTGAFNNFKVVAYQFDYEGDDDDGNHDHVGPDKDGICSVKGNNAVAGDVGKCVLDQARVSGFGG